MSKNNHLGVPGLNGLYFIPDDKDVPKAFSVPYFGVLAVDEFLWVKNSLQHRACSTNTNVELLWHDCKTSNYAVF